MNTTKRKGCFVNSAEVMNASTSLQQQDTSDLHPWKERWADSKSSLITSLCKKNGQKMGGNLREKQSVSQTTEQWKGQVLTAQTSRIYKKYTALKFQMAAFWHRL